MRLIIPLLGLVVLFNINIIEANNRAMMTRCACQNNTPPVDENLVALNNLSSSIARFLHVTHDANSVENSAKKAGQVIAESIKTNLKEANIPENMHKVVLNHMAKHITAAVKSGNMLSADEISAAIQNLATSIARFLHMTHDVNSLEQSTKKAAKVIAESIKHNLREASIPENLHKHVLNHMSKHLTQAIKA